MEWLYDTVPALHTFPVLAQAIQNQKPIPYLLRLIQEGADVNETVIWSHRVYYAVPLLVFTIERYGYTRNLLDNPPKLLRHLRYLLKVIYLLLEYGADPPCVSVLHALVPFLYEDPALLGHLIHHGMNIHLPVGTDGIPPLYRSIKLLRPWLQDDEYVQRRIAVIYQLLDHGADPSFQDKKGYTALHHLLVYPITTSLFELLQHMIPLSNIHLEDNQGNTPLHCYIDHHGEYPVQTVPPHQVIDLLLSAGANPLARNEQGDIPIEMRQRNGHPPFPGLEEYMAIVGPE